MNKIKIWLKAFRLHTLPLALANAVMGSLLALAYGGFRLSVFVLTIITIGALQILSNLANDYGDAVSGNDMAKRLGPKRVTATGMVTKKSIKQMIYAFAVLSFIAGSILIFVGLDNMPWSKIAVFYLLGLSAIAAAIKYTVGKKPYGYQGLGDIFVFLFFGLIGVVGTFYMHTQYFCPVVILPAVSIGLMSVGVLNINNLRDIESDRKTGKNTLVVQYGERFSRIYHIFLIAIAFATSIIFVLLQQPSWKHWLFLLMAPLFFRNCYNVFRHHSSLKLNAELKNLVIDTFVFALLFGIGMI